MKLKWLFFSAHGVHYRTAQLVGNGGSEAIQMLLEQ